MSEHVCLLCGAPACFFATATDRLLKTTGKAFDLYQCQSCDLLFLSPPPSPEEVEAFYPKGYWWQEPRRSPDGVNHLLKRLESYYRRLVLRDHVGFVMQTVRSMEKEGTPVALLDVGCSGGTLLYELSRRSVPVSGLDLSPEAVAHAREVYGLDCAVGDLTASLRSERRFSLITGFHVLEHLHDPRAFLAAVASRLEPRGHIILQVPNVRSLQFKIFGARWYALDPPRHLINFSDRALVSLLQSSGYEVLRTKRFSWRDDATSWASSLIPRLDPLRRTVVSLSAEERQRQGWAEALSSLLYFALVLAALPLAGLDSLAGRGATVMVEARRRIDE